MTNSSTDERVTELESRLTFQEDTIQALSDALADQQTRIDALESTMTLLVQTLDSAGGDDVQDEPPPHY